ncbi:coiled-coil domain-containing protein 160 isoform X1 [Petaurus breviceps papuanus]|uniref:coiled-coil domain-containing protein 160 isoform X1 n=1 Tax=Petaurus breviceps papuanus TaxID=3040969 RepID=UPI0036DC1492
MMDVCPFLKEQAEGSVEMETNGKHWVEKLFIPCFTPQDFFKQANQPEPFSQQLAFDQAKGVEEMYNLAIQKFQEEKKFKRKEFISPLIEPESEPKLTERKINISKKQPERNSACWDAADLNVGTEESPMRTEGHCIWNAKELAALRQETQKSHAEGISQKIQLCFLNAELEELNAKYRKIEADFENAERELLKSKREISFKTLHLQAAQKDSLRKDRELQALKNDISEKSINVKNLSEALLQAKQLIQKLDLENKDLKEVVKKLKQQIEAGNAALREKVKLHYKFEMKKIQRELEVVKNELKTEKFLHARNNKALELLRKHFSSLPVSSTLDSFEIDYL